MPWSEDGHYSVCHERGIIPQRIKASNSGAPWPDLKSGHDQAPHATPPGRTTLAVNALRNKRAQIAGDIEMHSREIDRLRSELIHLDATLRLFDPVVNPSDIPALRRHPRRTEWFARGEVTQRIYEALRENEIISPREVARAAMAAKELPDMDSLSRKDIIARFTNVVYDLTRRGQLVKIGHGTGARWKLAPDQPELI